MTRTLKTKCTNCQLELDGATHPTMDIGPKPGDISVCVYCGHVMAFTDTLGLRDLTDAEIVAVAGDKQLLEAQHFGAFFRKLDKENQ